jgi:hypothetical protein
MEGIRHHQPLGWSERSHDQAYNWVAEHVTSAWVRPRGGRVTAALANAPLWSGMFAIPMTIVVIMRRLGREHGLDDGYGPGDPSQEPDYRRWSR